jgi:hypothetical protein
VIASTSRFSFEMGDERRGSASWSTAERCAEPRRGTGGARRGGGRLSAWSGSARRAAACARAKASGGLEVNVPLVEPFTRPVLRDFAQDVLDAHLAQVEPDEMA